MITAAQALELVKRSDAEVEKCLALIGPAVEEAAKAGRRILPLSSIMQLTNVEDVSFHAQRAPGALTEFQTKLITALKGFGYMAALQPHGQPYVPRGLSDDEGNGPKYQHYTIIVRW